MSEYWISQGRKMCTYCKCWTADNKASINFHEQGKNHKENVKKKLDELRKKGLAEAKRKETEQSDMEKIEKAALASLKKDITSNPTMASAYGITEDKFEEVHKAALAYNAPKTTNSSRPSSSSNNSKGPSGSRTAKSAPTSSYPNTSARQDTAQAKSTDSTVHYMGDWYTAVNDEGYTYYWNTVTNETSWYQPDSPPVGEGGSTAVESAQTSTATTSTATTSTTTTSTATTSTAQSTVTESDKSSESTRPVPSAATRPPKASPYGQWQVIKEEEPEQPDFQLPYDISNYQVSTDDIPLPQSTSVAADTETAEPSADPSIEGAAFKRKFKEKELSLGNTFANSSSQAVTFKKRKFGANRQSRRQATDDE